MSQSRVVTGARVICYINGVRFGRVSDFKWDSATPRRAIHGIDSLEPYELAPMSTRCTGSLSLYRTAGDGGIEGPGIVASYQDIPREKYFSLTLIDRASNMVLFRADSCAVTNQSWGVAAKGVMTGSFSFEALSWSNEVKSQ